MKKLHDQGKIGKWFEIGGEVKMSLISPRYAGFISYTPTTITSQNQISSQIHPSRQLY